MLGQAMGQHLDDMHDGGFIVKTWNAHQNVSLLNFFQSFPGISS
jgi:hypothetical protein